MKIGERIKQRREQLEMSQDELARRLGYKSRSSINKIENDASGLPQSKIAAIAAALQTTPSHIMGWEEDKTKQPTTSELSNKKKDFIKRVEAMSDEQLDRLEQILALVESTGQ